MKPLESQFAFQLVDEFIKHSEHFKPSTGIKTMKTVPYYQDHTKQVNISTYHVDKCYITFVWNMTLRLVIYC